MRQVGLTHRTVAERLSRPCYVRRYDAVEALWCGPVTVGYAFAVYRIVPPSAATAAADVAAALPVGPVVSAVDMSG